MTTNLHKHATRQPFYKVTQKQGRVNKKQKKAVHVLVEDGDAAQLAAGPFGLVLGELWVDGLEKRAHEGELERGTDNRAFQPDVLDCRKTRRDMSIDLNLANCNWEGYK
jgi:hypothetical protein